jgi:hypothetical protein
MIKVPHVMSNVYVDIVISTRYANNVTVMVQFAIVMVNALLVIDNTLRA